MIVIQLYKNKPLTNFFFFLNVAFILYSFALLFTFDPASAVVLAASWVSAAVSSSALAHLPRLTFGKASAALIAWLHNGSCAHSTDKSWIKKKSGVRVWHSSRERKREVLDRVTIGMTL